MPPQDRGRRDQPMPAQRRRQASDECSERGTRPGGRGTASRRWGRLTTRLTTSRGVEMLLPGPGDDQLSVWMAVGVDALSVSMDCDRLSRRTR